MTINELKIAINERIEILENVKSEIATRQEETMEDKRRSPSLILIRSREYADNEIKVLRWVLNEIKELSK